MIYITQFIYIKEGREDVFDQFEALAMPIIPKYNGKLLLRVRPDPDSVIEAHMEKPYEIHFVEFPSEPDFNNFMDDNERKQFLHLKEESIKTVLLIKGTKLFFGNRYVATFNAFITIPPKHIKKPGYKSPWVFPLTTCIPLQMLV